MRSSRIVAIAAAALFVVPLTGLTITTAASASAISPAEFAARDEGYGATLAAAEQNARATIEGDYGPCSGFYYYAYGQLASGEWWADVSAECSYYH